MASEFFEIDRTQNGQVVRCTKCKQVLAKSSENWKNNAAFLESPLTKIGSSRVSDKFVIREFICPKCATVLDTEIALRSDPPLEDNVDYSK